MAGSGERERREGEEREREEGERGGREKGERSRRAQTMVVVATPS